LIEYDVTDVPESGGGGEQAPVGTYDAKISHCVHRETKKDGSPVDDLEVAFQIINEDESYSWVYTYIGLDEPSAWKMREFTDALSLKAKGKLDPDKMIGKQVRLKVNAGSYDGEYRAKAGRIMSSSNGDGPSASGEEPDDDATPDADDGFAPTREAESDAGSYDDWSEEDIKGEFTDRGLEISGRKTQKAMITALRTDDEEASGDADTTGDHDASASSGYPDGYTPQRETDEDSYDSWSDDDVEGEFTDRGLELAGGRGNARTKQLKALREDDANPKDGSGGGAADDYDNWDLEQLVTEAKERNLAVPRGKKSEADIIEILRADDGTDPF
jgi:hypothetical protein